MVGGSSAMNIRRSPMPFIGCFNYLCVNGLLQELRGRSLGVRSPLDLHL